MADGQVIKLVEKIRNPRSGTSTTTKRHCRIGGHRLEMRPKTMAGTVVEIGEKDIGVGGLFEQDDPDHAPRPTAQPLSGLGSSLSVEKRLPLAFGGTPLPPYLSNASF